MNTAELTTLIKRLLAEQGFERVGMASARPLERGTYLRGWLGNGNAGAMGYLHDHVDKRADPSQLLPGARSVIVVALNYNQEAPRHPDNDACGRVARYAWGNDYHQVMKRKLHAVVDRLREEVREDFQAQVCVDTAPILERELAMRAGVGWIGKNTLVLHQDLGSYFFLGAIVTTLELDCDSPATDHCGSCTRCLEACPTQAFPAAYHMDARRCISYHTIELRSEIPAEFHAAIADWVFGCDICQEVCPYNSSAPLSNEAQLAVRSPGPFPLLRELLEWTAQDYRRELRGSALRRAKLDMLKRNATIALQNHPQ